jgi:hypothetical protein
MHLRIMSYMHIQVICVMNKWGKCKYTFTDKNELILLTDFAQLNQPMNNMCMESCLKFLHNYISQSKLCLLMELFSVVELEKRAARCT